jgi:hypothetical protein
MEKIDENARNRRNVGRIKRNVGKILGKNFAAGM